MRPFLRQLKQALCFLRESTKLVMFCTIASAWFGLFSVYLFSAHQLPYYKPLFAKSVLTIPMSFLAVGLVFCGFYFAWVSDPLTLKLFNLVRISNSGIADNNIQNVSLLLTVILGIPIAVSYKLLKQAEEKIESARNCSKFFPYAGFLVAFVATIFATSAALLA
jgi:hypothetical protein